MLTAFVGSTILLAQTPAHVSSITANLKSPVRVAIDQSDIIYITDAVQKNILTYNISGNFLGALNPGGSPVSIAINESNEIFIGDAESGHILKVSAAGTATTFYSGTLFPVSMVFSPSGLLYVVDSKLKKVLVLNQSGSIVQTIGSGVFTYPTGIAYDQKNNRILVAEHGGIGTGFNPVEKVRIFSLQGDLLNSFGSHGNGDGQFYRIQGISVGRCGNIYVPDPFQGNVSIFDENGTFISRFAQYGENAGQLNMPLDILIDSHDRLLITSMNNDAIELFDINFLLPTSSITTGNKTICTGETVEIPVHFTGTAPWSFTYTVNGVNPVNITSTTDNPYILNATDAGTYAVTAVSDANNSGTCFSGNPTIIVNDAIPTATIVTSSASVCSGQSAEIAIDFTGTAPYSFSYTMNGQNPVQVNNVSTDHFILQVTEAGTYEIASLSSGSCNGTFVGVANIIVNNPNTISVNAAICEGNNYILGTQTLSASGYYSEHFVSAAGCDSLVNLNLQVNPSIQANSTVTICEGSTYALGTQLISTAGVYTELFEAVNGCDSIVTLDLFVSQMPVASFSAIENNLELGFINNSSNVTSHLWDFGDNTTSTEINPVHTYAASGVYVVTLTALNSSCGDVSTSLTYNLFGVNVSSISSENQVKIFPNPSKGLIYIEKTKSENNIMIEIIDITGRVIFSKILNPQISKEQVEMSEFANGIYTVRLISQDFMKIEKLFLQK